MRNIMPATIEDLPDPIIEYILSYLSPYRDLKRCMQVNRAWYRYVCDVVRKTQRDFHNAVCGMSVQWCHLVAEPGPTISKRYSHSACCSENSMYIFGGCTTANTTFNDLWRLDLGTRCWIRPLATGTYPPPKACATLVSHEDNLVLFGGWTHTAPYPLHQVWRVFNQIHLYNIITNRWTQVISVTSCPPMAGHSATVHGDLMVVFGGIQRQICDGPFQSSNDLWTLDLKTFKWQKQITSSVQPPPRYGHSQIAIDKNHLLIIGGCGGPNTLYTDIWLLKMSDDIQGLWEWQEMEVRMKENGAPHLAFHPACKVGNQVVVMSKAQKSRTSPSSLPHLLRAPSRIWVPPRLDVEDSIEMKVAKHPPDIEPCVNGKRGVLKRHIDRQHNSVGNQMSSSDEDEFHSQDIAKRKSSNSFLHSGVHCSTDNNKSVYSSPNSMPSTSGYQNSASRNSLSPSLSTSAQNGNLNGDVKTNVNIVDSQNNSPKDIPRQNCRQNSPLNPISRRNRQRQLEGLDRMEQRLRDLRAGTLNFPMVFSRVFKKHACNETCFTTKNPMCLYVLDISTASTDGYVTWRMLKNQSQSAPEEIILYSLVLGKGELIMFGGIQKDLNSRQQEGETVPEVVSNSLHFMTAERFVI